MPLLALLPGRTAGAHHNGTSHDLRPTDTTVSCDPSSLAQNAPTTCTATVTEGGNRNDKTAPAGSVTWVVKTGSGTFSGSPCTLSEVAGSNPPASSCKVTYTPTSAPGAENKIRATYGGSGVHRDSADDETVGVTKRATSTSLSCTPAPLPVDSATTCTATVSDTSDGTKSTPTGTVTWSKTHTGGTLSATSCTLNSGKCSVTYSAALGSQGSHGISASYGGSDSHNTSSTSTNLTVTKRSTSTAVACSPASLAIGNSTTCTATVSDTADGTKSTSTGTVTWSLTAGSGTFSAGTCSLNTSGSCQVTYTPSTVATHELTASYGGDSAHDGSAEKASVSVTKRSTLTSPTCSNAQIAVGDSTGCSASVSDDATNGGTAATPAGSVGWTSDKAGTFSPTSCSLSNGSCSTTYSPSLGSTGDHNLTASYGGSDTHLASSGKTSVAAVKRASTTGLVCDSPVLVNQASTCKATVASSGSTTIVPGGSVTFSSDKVGTFSAPSCTLASGTCSVSYTPGAGSAGTHRITASYGGDVDHEDSGHTSELVATRRATATVVDCASVAVNEISTCKATVTDTSDAGTKITPGGSVTFGSDKAGTFSAASCALVSGECSVTYTPHAGSAGTHMVRASYSADGTHEASEGRSDVAVTKRTTSPSVQCDSVPVNEASTCVVTVTDTSGGTKITPGGSVDLTSDKAGTFSATSCTLDANGACSVTYTPAAGTVGTHTISASYSGDNDHTASKGGGTVEAAKRTTSPAVQCNSVPVNQASTCVVTVNDTSGGTKITPTGSVVALTTDSTGTFSATSCTLGTNGSCSVTYTPAAGTVGFHAITATYGGDANHLDSKGGATFEATQRATSTSLSCTPASVVEGSTTSCTATVSDASGGTKITPGGAVGFALAAGNGTLGATSCTLDTNAACSISYTPAAGSAGTHSIAATYGGDANHTGSAGGTNLTVTPPNEPPVVTGVSPAGGSLYKVNDSVSVSASFSDSTAAPHTCSINWESLGTTVGSVAQTADGGTCTGSRSFTSAGVYTIDVIITDAGGLKGQGSTYVVVYDPNGGFVTGGGWINSPKGAYAGDPELTGKANFGFVSKYQKGATTPTGQTEFHFQAAGFKFNSTSYEWLVVSGAKAQYKGKGTVNGVGDYSFLLTVTDGQVTGGGGVDKFRIKITGPNGVVYDNVPGAGDDMKSFDPQAIGGGSIVIHAK